MDKTDTRDRLFFSEKVPILQNRVYADEKSAKAAPYGSLDIRVDPKSGLAVNVDYDQRSVRYDKEYDNSVPSDAFLKYYDDIADYLAKHYDLTKGIVLDVGCGKGTFLSRLAGRFGFVRGLGIDPAYEGPETICDGRVRFIKEYFATEHVHETPALVLCRHTLEHISRPAGFLSGVFRSLHQEKNVPVFIEVPDLSWIIKSNAFWDFCYEHVNYFTRESLARCIEKAGARVSKISGAFGGQYLWAEAIINPTESLNSWETSANELPRSTAAKHLNHASPLCPLSANGEGKDEVGGDASKYPKGYEAKAAANLIKHVDIVVERARDLAGRRRIVIWGMATKGVMYSLYLFNRDIRIDHCVDINARKQEKYCPLSGLKIISPEILEKDQEYAVICMNPNYVSEIIEYCHRLELNAQFFNPDVDKI
jgi:SAM-dependent methyltransferase